MRDIYQSCSTATTTNVNHNDDDREKKTNGKPIRGDDNGFD